MMDWRLLRRCAPRNDGVILVVTFGGESAIMSSNEFKSPWGRHYFA